MMALRLFSRRISDAELMAKQLVEQDNYIELLEGQDDVIRCPKCKTPMLPFNHGFKSKRKTKRYDVSFCQDGFRLLSPRAKTFFETHATSPIEFFETGAGYFVMRPERFVFLEMQYINYGSEALCETCGRFHSVIGSPLGVLKGQAPVGPFDVLRSAVELGPRPSKTFEIVVGDEFAKKFNQERLSGARCYDFEPNELFVKYPESLKTQTPDKK